MEREVKVRIGFQKPESVQAQVEQFAKSIEQLATLFLKKIAPGREPGKAVVEVKVSLPSYVISTPVQEMKPDGEIETEGEPQSPGG